MTAASEHAVVAAETGPLIFSLGCPGERFAKLSIWGVAVVAVWLSLLAFVAGASSHTTAGHWLLAMFMVPVAPLSSAGFVLAIARYRHSRVAISLTLVCFGLLALIFLSAITETATQGQSSGGESYGLVAAMVQCGLSPLAGSFCLVALRIGQSIKREFSRRRTHATDSLERQGQPVRPEVLSRGGTHVSDSAEVSLFRIPKSKRLILALFALWSGLFLNLLLTIQEASLASEASRVLKDLILFPGVGAIASGLALFWVPAIPMVMLFTAATCTNFFRSPKIAKICITAYLGLSMIGLFVGFFLGPAPATAVAATDGYISGGWRGALWEGGKETVKTTLHRPMQTTIGFTAGKVLAPVAIFLWSVYTIGLWAAINKETRESPVFSQGNFARGGFKTSNSSSHPLVFPKKRSFKKGFETSSRKFTLRIFAMRITAWFGKDFLPKLRTGAISVAATWPVVFTFFLFAYVMNGGQGKVGVPVVIFGSVKLAMLIPLPGVALIVAGRFWGAPQTQLLSWQPWELASHVWLWHLLPLLLLYAFGLSLLLPLALVASLFH